MQFGTPGNSDDSSQVRQLTQDCAEWVRQRLPVGLPPSARRAAIQNMTSRLNPGFRASLILKYQNREITDQEIEELRFQLFRSACCEAAQTVAVHEGMAEVDRWRWRESPHGTAANPRYLENLEYEFNAIYDMRKLWFEFQLQLERTALPPKRVAEQAAYYEDCLNKRFRTPHWRWDPGTFTFAEISDSKYVDGNGREQPNEKTLDGLIDRYAR